MITLLVLAGIAGLLVGIVAGYCVGFGDGRWDGLHEASTIRPAPDEPDEPRAEILAFPTRQGGAA